MADARPTDIFEKLHLADFDHHIFLRVVGKSARQGDQDESWAFLKQRLTDLGLVDVERGIFRSKARCMRVCAPAPARTSGSKG